MSLEALRSHLCSLSGCDLDETRVEHLLFESWHELNIISEDEKLEAYKLLNRTEEMTWSTPLLAFDIERHGAPVNGSIYAEVQHWVVDVHAGTALLQSRKRRQLGNRDKVLNVKSLADEMANLILSKAADARLVWKSAAKVRVSIADTIPETNKMTTYSRRKRFRTALQEALRSRGWRMTTVNTFEKTASS